MDIVTYALCKKLVAGIAGGISSFEVDGQTLIMHTSDGQTLEMTFPTPADGISITDVQIDENNHLQCTLSDESVIDAGEIKTLQGPPGEKGEAFKYEDFTPEQLEALKGKDGEPGKDGKDGQNGAPGKDGYTPQKGVDYFTEQDIQEVTDKVTENIDLSDYVTQEAFQKLIDTVNKESVIRVKQLPYGDDIVTSAIYILEYENQSDYDVYVYDTSKMNYVKINSSSSSGGGGGSSSNNPVWEGITGGLDEGVVWEGIPKN